MGAVKSQQTARGQSFAFQSWAFVAGVRGAGKWGRREGGRGCGKELGCGGGRKLGPSCCSICQLSLPNCQLSSAAFVSRTTGVPKAARLSAGFVSSLGGNSASTSGNSAAPWSGNLRREIRLQVSQEREYASNIRPVTNCSSIRAAKFIATSRKLSDILDYIER